MKWIFNARFKKGLFRLWIVLAIPWIAWFGYQTWLNYNEYIGFQELAVRLDKAIGESASQYERDPTSVNRYFYESHKAQGQEMWKQYHLRKTTFDFNIKLVAIPLILPAIYLIALWVINGFRKSEAENREQKDK